MKEFLSQLIEKDIHITLEKGELTVKFPKRGTDTNLLEEIRSRKQLIIDYLNDLRGNEHVIIPVLAEADSYPISDAQHRLWILSQFEGSSIAYNMPESFQLDRGIDIQCFKRAVDSTIKRHEILRTVFRENETGEIRQRILKKEDMDFSIYFRDFRKAKRKEEKINEYIEADSYRAYDLERGPLLRAALFQVEDDSYFFYYNMHHIISDGWSMNVLKKDVLTYYKAYEENREPLLKPLRIQYKDYSAWQLSCLEEESFKADRAYWLGHLSGELPLLDLPGLKRRPKVITHNGYGLGSYIDPDTTRKLKKYSLEQGGSLFITLLAAWNVLMYRYTSQTDIIIGTPVAGRENVDLEDQIGFYINTLALRNYIDPTQSFRDFCKGVRASTLAGFAHKAYPFDRLIQELDVVRDISRSPVFDVLLDFHNTEENLEHVALSEEEINSISDFGRFPTKYDLELHFTEEGDCISVQVNFNEDIYAKPAIETGLEHYKNLIASLLNNPEVSVGRADFLSKEEKEKLIVEFNHTKTPYIPARTLISLFEEQVAKTPDRTAIKDKNSSLSYKELDELSNQLAHCIIEKYDVKANEFVGIKLDKTKWAIISMLGILKSGAVYIPIDPEYPLSRKQYILSESKIKLLITTTDYLFDDEGFDGSVFAIDVEFDNELFSKERINQVESPESLAYVIYTSGSTGTPKGVLIEHRSLLNYITWALSTYSKGHSGSLDFGLFTSLSFDLTVTSIYLPLVSGGELRIFNSTSDVPTVLKTYFQSAIGCIKLTPAHISLLNHLDIEHTLVQIAIVGGDILENTHIEILKRLNPAIRIYNEYGPTEATVGCSAVEIKNEEKRSIGRPIANTRIYVLSEEEQLQPLVAIGEICIGGAGLARGYLNNEEWTAKKFIKDPFKKGERLYKTGDLGRWLPDGNLEFVGRKDDQVKIKGYRIELSEIEQALLKNPSIKEAIVIAREDEEKQKQLVAYIVAEDQQNISELRSYLRGSIPEYMLPVYYVQVKSLPLNSNGKIERKLLPDPKDFGLVSGVEYVAPKNEIEKKMVQIWQEVLNAENIGVKDDFFVLGGSSIKTVQVSREYAFAFDEKIPLNYFIANPTISKHAEFLVLSLNQVRENQKELIKLNSFSKSNKNMLMFPPYSGESAYYLEFARLIEDRYNCYGINYGLDHEFGSLTELFDHCVQLINKCAFDRITPLSILAFSMGAPIAFEVVKLLEELNYHCELFLIDTLPFTNSVLKEMEKVEPFDNPMWLDQQVLMAAEIFPKESLKRIRKRIVDRHKLLNSCETKGKIRSNISCLEGLSGELPFDVNLWREHTHGLFCLEKIEAKHNDIFEDRKNHRKVSDFIQRRN